ncbi:MAG: dual OB domain-containing protein [Halothece sp.]
MTDPVFTEKLQAGYQPTGNYLVTVSLGMPWAPKKWEGEAPCWKLIAGVIQISS